MKEISCISMLGGLLLLLTQCTGSKSSVPSDEAWDIVDAPIEKVVRLECDFDAKIKVDGQEACGVLFYLPNGLLLQPASMPEGDFSFNDGDDVRLSYRILEDVATSCPGVVGVADITCISKMPGKYQGNDECVKVNDPFDVKWMVKLMNEIDARKVTRYVYRERPAYVFESMTFTIICDCYGQELCRERAGEGEGCMPVRSQLSNGYVILVVNE